MYYKAAIDMPSKRTACPFHCLRQPILRSQFDENEVVRQFRDFVRQRLGEAILDAEKAPPSTNPDGDNAGH
jgi:hypothetical protein